MNLIGKPKLIILDLLSGDARVADKVPFIIGGSTGADWKITASANGTAVNEVHFSSTGSSSGYQLTPHYQCEKPILMDGALIEVPTPLPPGRGAMLKLHGHLFGLCSTKDPQQFLNQVNLGQWSVFDGSTNENLGSVGFSDITAIISSSGALFENCAISLPSLGAPGAWLKDLPEIIPPPATTFETQTESIPEPQPITQSDPIPEIPKAEEIPSNEGEFQCPICWLHFDGKHTKHISSHAELLGDSVLGKAEHRRFIPTKWDSSGNALDDFGLSAPDTACPHCHERLPAGFGEFQQHIFSIVGAPTSGKSYYLAILLKSLKRHLFHKFEVSFMDQDPEYNIELNDIINKLFTARSAPEGRIQKTQMKGINYKQVTRGGQDVDLPKPYMFSISRTNVENTDSCIVFYDNAGEHFLPNHSRAEDFHILHVAKASVLFFLYDPLVNIDVRHALVNVESDQLELETVPDMQATILSQMNVKISRALGKPTAQKLDAPLAVVVGKCDIWHSLVPDWKKIVDPTGKDNVLNHRAIDSNSAIIRGFLNEYSPEIVATVERMSRTVRYFPVSAFGHKPKEHVFKDSEGREVKDVAPEAGKIKPFLIEIPTEWAISQTIPDLLPEVGR
ncbi:MAG: hypothetical protein HN531_14910 [Opitutae bacterium]|nr:hypothetical protein [Opitutae bacterium]